MTTLPKPRWLPMADPSPEADSLSEAVSHLAVTQAQAPKGPKIQFARFAQGRLERFSCRTDELEYIAVSHVFSETQWLDVAGVEGQVLASPWKARFIESRLPELVGSTPFWMDILTVDQTNETEVVCIVQDIPTIFRGAVKTLAIREDDGLYGCCSEKLMECDSLGSGSFPPDLLKHFCLHFKALMIESWSESYLQRLWTLQECMLSHTVQFVVCQRSLDERTRFVASINEVIWKPQNDYRRTLYALAVLAHCFSEGSTDETSTFTDFINSYVQGGIVHRLSGDPRLIFEDIHAGKSRSLNTDSQRSASKSRDYIFAKMPQFPWYDYPEGAESMSFGEIFLNLYEQASLHGHPFAPKICASMIESSTLGLEDDWLPSQRQPEPECLGDFLKLLGERIRIRDTLLDEPHATSIVRVLELGNIAETNAYLDLIQESMLCCRGHWDGSNISGELSKFGSYPNDGWHLDSLDAQRSGWKVIPCEACADDILATHHKACTGLKYEEDDSTIEEAGTILDHRFKEDYVPLDQHARIVLAKMWSAVNPDETRLDNWLDFQLFRKDMDVTHRWCQPLLDTMTMMAAMVSCHMPLSAVAYVRKYFVPVLLRFDDGTLLLGLLARHARPSERWKVESLVCAGRHLSISSVGKDLFLVNPRISAAPVGIAPDFLRHSFRDGDNATLDQEAKWMKTLYGDAFESNEEGQLYKPYTLDGYVRCLANHLKRSDDSDR